MTLAKTLPQRIVADIKEQQFRSEILVAIVQLVILSLFYLLYLSAPASFASDAPVRATPLGLSLFTILVLTRLWFAITHQLNRILLAFFVIAEMAVLIFTIWALHLQFESQPSLYLKSTALFYVFIVIALRGLRFEPLWVLLSGLTAVTGWILLIIYAIYKAPANPITWDYVTYMSSSKIHLGGELDKILSIIMVTVVLALVLVRARGFLVRAMTETQAASDLSQFFDPDIAKRITSADIREVAGHGELRNAAVLFVDIRGFTKLSARLTPPEIIALLGEYQQLIVPIIQQNNGNIDKFIGDGIMASFGAVKPSNHYAADALRAVDQILKRKKPVVDIGMGVVAGEVIFGVIGNKFRLEYTVIGNAVNFAAKLEKHTKKEKVSALTTLETLQLAEQQGYVDGSKKQILNSRKVVGIVTPINIVALE